jgi:TPR repeat protein
MYRLALLHFENHAGAIDDKTALDLLTRAADSGLADAQFELGELLFKGEGLPKDPVAGNHRLLSAAQLGHIGAQVEYAIHLFNGDGVAKNEADAAAWFERAAAMGNPVAQNRLARILSVGSGVPADPVAAAKWHFLARGAGLRDDYLDQFVGGLSAAQRQQAMAAAQRWPAN